MHKKEIINGFMTCSKCERSLPATLEYFFKNKYTSVGLQVACKECYGGRFGNNKVEAIPVIDGHKKCDTCKRDLLATREFYFMTSDGYFTRSCKECMGHEFMEKSPQAFVIDGMKVCPRCNNNLPATTEYFHSCKTYQTGLQSYCKKCRREINELNADVLKDKRHEYYINNKPKINARNKKYGQDNKDVINLNARERRKIDPEFKLLDCLRGRINKALKNGGTKSKRTIELLGCSVRELMNHLESQWEPGMNWGNRTRHGWHVEHIVPCAYFNMLDPKQQEACFHWSNLRPMWSDLNYSKGSRHNGILYRKKRKKHITTT